MAYRNGPKIITDGLVLCLDAAGSKSYPGSGSTWYDVSTNKKNATLTGTTFSSSDGGSFYFDESDAYASVPNFNVNSFTVCSYVKLNKTNDYQGIIGQASSIFSNLSFAFRFLNSNQLNISLSGSGTSSSNYKEVTAGTLFTSGQWYFVSCTFDATTDAVKLYSAGNEIGSNTCTFDLYPSTSNFIIGGYTFGNGLSYLLNGNIALLQLYNNALSQDKIKQNYNATKGRFGL